MHIIKIGSMYLTADGTMSARQSDAMRVDLSNHQPAERPRAVKLTPKRTADAAPLEPMSPF